jgi:type VI secretion system VgrG family protein
MLTADSGEPRSFHGYLTAVELNGANGGLARYTLTLQPWTAFLSRTRDSRVFQDKTVFDILDAVFSAWQGRGKLAPAWRYDIADPGVYAVRSLVTQYQESDLAFVERLMSEEGLFYFFEHEGDTGSGNLGTHQLVIADHNGAFKPNRQALVRYTQPGAVMVEDSIDRWRRELRLQTAVVELSSWDYRALDVRPVSASVAQPAGPALTTRDSSGPYAYPTRAQGQRLADRQAQALETSREVFTGAGTVRTLAPGTTFTLSGHAVHDNEDDVARTFIVTRARHLMHNNLSAELKADISRSVGEASLSVANFAGWGGGVPESGSGAGERPLYRNRIDAIRVSVPFRASRIDGHGRLLHPRPTMRGQQSAVVVGPPGAVIHTDRDHRVKVQFHWQRGTASHNRLSHPYPDGHTGAPGDDTAGTWVRVAAPLAPVAGENWGSHALPRVGQEVLVDFLEGDIDRPVVIGALYNGSGEQDAQHNKVSCGAGVATGNAPAWFPGEADAHAHAAVMSGLKSQAMQASQNGTGAYSQLVFDDTPGEPRVALHRHAGAHKGTDELNLGHLRHQVDNQRLKPVGFGAELKTDNSLALRAGQGMLLSTDQRNGANGSQMDSREAFEQIRASQELQEALADTARKHNAVLQAEEGAGGTTQAKLAAIAQMEGSANVVNSTGTGGGTGAGGADAYSEPQFQLSSPRGIAAATPANAILSAGTTSSISAGQDINFVAQANSIHSVAAGISFFTYGKASNKNKPNQETGIKLHAASGKLSAQSQSGETRITADKGVTVASVTKSVTASAKNHVLLTAQGAGLKIEGGNITLQAPGKVEFKAAMKEFAGPVSVPTVEVAKRIHELHMQRDLEIQYVDADGNLLTDEPISLHFANGEEKRVRLDGSGKVTIKGAPLGPLRARQPRRK